MNNDDLISTLGVEDCITLSSPDLYDWDAGSPSLTASTISTIDLTSSTVAAGSLALNPNAFPYSNVVPNGGYTLTPGAISGAITGGPYLGSNPAVNVWSDTTDAHNPSGKIDLKGDNADITINGRSLNKTIQALEERLNMLRPNEHLEAEWDQLRELGEAYRKLEADLIEKQRAWDILKKQ